MKKIKKTIESLEDVIADMYSRADKGDKVAFKEKDYEAQNDFSLTFAILNEVIKRTGSKLYYPIKKPRTKT